MPLDKPKNLMLCEFPVPEADGTPGPACPVPRDVTLDEVIRFWAENCPKGAGRVGILFTDGGAMDRAIGMSHPNEGSAERAVYVPEPWHGPVASDVAAKA